MTDSDRTAAAAADGPGRFPGFDVLHEVGHWDPVTAGVVLDRLGRPPDIRFFTPAEEATATALLAQLLDLDDDPAVPVAAMIDARLAEQQTDGWRYQSMAEDGRAWRDSLAGLDADAQARHGRGFAQCGSRQQGALLTDIHGLGSGEWHAMPAAAVWSLWTRYACTAFYSHPVTWNEIGFPGPAYPRGYKNPGIDTREPFEVADARPLDNPAGQVSRHHPVRTGIES